MICNVNHKNEKTRSNCPVCGKKNKTSNKQQKYLMDSLPDTISVEELSSNNGSRRIHNDKLLSEQVQSYNDTISALDDEGYDKESVRNALYDMLKNDVKDNTIHGLGEVSSLQLQRAINADFDELYDTSIR